MVVNHLDQLRAQKTALEKKAHDEETKARGRTTKARKAVPASNNAVVRCTAIHDGVRCKHTKVSELDGHHRTADGKWFHSMWCMHHVAC